MLSSSVVNHFTMMTLGMVKWPFGIRGTQNVGLNSVSFPSL